METKGIIIIIIIFCYTKQVTNETLPAKAVRPFISPSTNSLLSEIEEGINASRNV